MDKIEKIRAEIERMKNAYLNRSFTFVPTAMNQLLEFLDTLSEEPDKSLEEAAEEYRRESFKRSVIPQIDGPVNEYGGNIKSAFIAGAEWQKEQMMKIITKDDNLEEAGVQYVETYFRDIDWTPNVIKSCLEEAFISGGEYVFKQIKYE